MKTVLLVDDEFALSDTLKDFLEGEGYLVECASNGKDALEIMSTKVPDLVVTDLMMPIMDGKAVIRAMQENHALKSIPVILTSGARRQIALPPGEDTPPYSAFLRKPFQLDRFLNLVSSLIHARDGE